MPDGLFTDYTTVAEPSLAGLVAWLEGQDPKATYNWFACDECLVGQYMRQYRRTNETAGDAYKRFHDIAGDGLLDERLVDIHLLRPYTLGAALHRARKALAEQEG